LVLERGAWSLKKAGRLRLLIVAGLLSLSLIAVGCAEPQTAGGSEGDGGGGQNLSGTIEVDGSSTVFPITEAMAEEFGGQNPNVRVTVGVSGTGGGFERFCAGETAVQDASRPIDPEEREICEQNGIEFIELPVAYDGLSVVVNPNNDWADSITVEELKKIWEPAAEGKIERWNQVRPSWPDRPLVLAGAGTDSGTYDYFTEAIVGEEGASRGDYQASEDDNVLVQAVAQDENALGFFGLSYYEENRDKLKLLGIDDGEGPPIKPSQETVQNLTYQPLSRPLFIYVSKKAAEDRPEVAAFVDFYVNPENLRPINEEVGYVPLPDDVEEEVVKEWEDRTTGTKFPEGAAVGVKIDEVLEESK
jgi:phosphate transport system substrate-binding protein